MPEDVKVSFEFDQSTYVTQRDSQRSPSKAALGALLTGLMVLLFLRDWRSALIVVADDPVRAARRAWSALWLTGQTINIMTLGGLALAVGILVDEATVAIENIHTHLARGEPSRTRRTRGRARDDRAPRCSRCSRSSRSSSPSFFMAGVPRSLFVPLSLAVGFAMIASYLLSSTLVPVLVGVAAARTDASTNRGLVLSSLATSLHAIASNSRDAACAVPGADLLCAHRVGSHLSSSAANRHWIFFRQWTRGCSSCGCALRPARASSARKSIALKALEADPARSGRGQRRASHSAYVGTQPASYPVNTIHLWTSGPQEAVLMSR